MTSPHSPNGSRNSEAHRDADRSLEQEIAAGRSPATPFLMLGSVVGVIAVLVAIALGLAALAYFLA